MCIKGCFFFLFFPRSADVLSEEAILKWYTEAHVAKGKSVFLEQMKKFVEWLKNAEEGKTEATLNILLLSQQRCVCGLWSVVCGLCLGDV